MAERFGCCPGGATVGAVQPTIWRRIAPKAADGSPANPVAPAGHRPQPARGLLLRCACSPGARRAERIASVSSPSPHHADDDDSGDRPVRKLGGEEHVADEERDREHVEDPVREDRAEERRAVAAPLGHVPSEDGDPRELARSRGAKAQPAEISGA